MKKVNCKLQINPGMVIHTVDCVNEHHEYVLSHDVYGKFYLMQVSNGAMFEVLSLHDDVNMNEPVTHDDLENVIHSTLGEQFVGYSDNVKSAIDYIVKKCDQLTTNIKNSDFVCDLSYTPYSQMNINDMTYDQLKMHYQILQVRNNIIFGSDSENDYEWFTYTKYNDVNCSKCGEPLKSCAVVSIKGDDCGYGWRMFCIDEFENLLNEYSLSQIYNMYQPSTIN